MFQNKINKDFATKFDNNQLALLRRNESSTELIRSTHILLMHYSLSGFVIDGETQQCNKLQIDTATGAP